MKRFIALAVLLSFAVPSFAKESKRLIPEDNAILSDYELLDIPTAAVVDYQSIAVKTRVFNNGGVTTGALFSVHPRVNLGATATLENLIGSSDNIRFVRPDIQAKFRIYDGNRAVPAFAVGYDGLGHYYDFSKREYQEKARGMYIVATSELAPGFQMHPAFNFSDFESSSFFGSIAFNYNLQDTINFMLEWDNIHKLSDSHVNLGTRFYVTPFFFLDLGLRDLGCNNYLANGSRQLPERVAQIRYISNF